MPYKSERRGDPVSCGYCGKEFRPWHPSRPSTFCSRACVGKGRKKQTFGEAQCQGCLENFTKTGSTQILCLKCGNGEQKWYAVWRRYKLTKPMWEAMYFEQDGTCPICGEREANHVDHDHESGEVRGLLCGRCNMALHYMENDIWRGKADEYLAVSQ